MRDENQSPDVPKDSSKPTPGVKWVVKAMTLQHGEPHQTQAIARELSAGWTWVGAYGGFVFLGGYVPA